MNKNATIIGVGVVIVIILLGAWWVMSQNQVMPNITVNETEPGNDQNETTPIVEIETELIPKTHEITYTSSGYSPSTLTIKVGDTVSFKNNSTKGMWPASAMHPIHAVYSGTSLQTHCPDNENDDFDACKSVDMGQTWKFTFNKAGAWGLHDHITASKFGKITVE